MNSFYIFDEDVAPQRKKNYVQQLRQNIECLCNYIWVANTSARKIGQAKKHLQYLSNSQTPKRPKYDGLDSW